jgi:hypothetical protein
VLELREIAEFDMRVALQMAAEDSRNLIDSEAAVGLGPHRAVFLDTERTGRLEKFRPYGPPAIDWMAQQAAKLSVRAEVRG